MRKPLTQDEVQNALGKLPGWSTDGSALTRTFRFDKFADGIAFVQRVARAADEADHHPDIDIRYTNITMRLSTHDAGGITPADVRLAEQIDSLVPRSA
jgi:4a-hydroxytetrahydrobiopterin dehydratase